MSKVYAVVGTNQQTIVNDRVSYSPAENEIRMKSERPEGNYIASQDGVWVLDKSQKINELKSIRDQKEVEPIATDKGLFDYDDKARARLAIARQELEDQGSTGTITWTTADNQRVPLSVQDFIDINHAAAIRSNQLHIQYNELKSQVEAATTAEQVDAVVWPTTTEENTSGNNTPGEESENQ